MIKFLDVTQSAAESNVALSELELQRASSTTTAAATTTTTTSVQEMNLQLVTISPRSLPIDPAEWSIDDVMRYLSSIDSALNVHAQLFHKHVSQVQQIIITIFFTLQ